MSDFFERIFEAGCLFIFWLMVILTVVAWCVHQ